MSSSWGRYPLHAALLHSIQRRGFERPTEIQKRTFDIFLRRGESQEVDNEPEKVGPKNDRLEVKGRDIIGVAQTASL